MKHEFVYYLMHKNDIVIAVTLDQVNGSIIKTSAEGNSELLPLGAKVSVNNLKKWWDRRAVPMSQGNMKRILQEAHISSTQEYLMRNLGLSLSDHYWIKPIDSKLVWEDVSLFSNTFRDLVGECQFIETQEIDFTNQTIFYPSASLQGELRKKWVIQDGERYLIKGNYGSSYQQSINEVIATLLHQKQQRVPYTEYKLCKLDTTEGEGLGCICKDFATEDLEFIPAYDVVCSKKKRNDVSEFEHFIQICVENGLKETSVRFFLEYQILTDFIITNTDRHFNNFGVLRDTNTLQFVSMAPIFDSGNSMFWNRECVPRAEHLLDIAVSSFKKKEMDLLSYVSANNQVDLSLIPTRDEIRELLVHDPQREKQREDILAAYEKKICLLDDFLNGKKLTGSGKKVLCENHFAD